MSAAPIPSSDYRRVALAGYSVIVFCFGGFATWARLANIDSAVTAQGAVALESRRQLVQHLEGGIVKEIFVREGDAVKEGQLLFRLDDTQTRANLDLYHNQLDAATAQESRLIAERDQKASLVFPTSLTSRNHIPSVAKIVADQKAQFEQRRASLESQITVMRSRQVAFTDEIEGLKREGEAAQQQLFFINDELKGVRELALKGLIPKSRQSALEREKARLDGVVGRNEVDAAKARNSINEIDLQINQLQQKMQEEVAAALQEIRPKISDLAEKVRVAEDSLRRTDLLAPRTGIVQNVKVSTIGQVLKPGEVLLELVPQKDQLIVEAQVQVVDINSIARGMTAEVRFPSFHARTTPVILGKVRAVSQDRLMDEATRQPYFLAQIATEDTDVPADLKARLRAGMPAEVVFPTGERTVFEYFLQPLRESFRQTLREK